MEIRDIEMIEIEIMQHFEYKNVIGKNQMDDIFKKLKDSPLLSSKEKVFHANMKEKDWEYKEDWDKKGCGRKFLTGRKRVNTIATDIETGEQNITYHHGYYRICGNNLANALCPECSPTKTSKKTWEEYTPKEKAKYHSLTDKEIKELKDSEIQALPKSEGKK